jgi:hypothetical protein
VTLRAREIKHVWHLEFSQRINVLPGLLQAFQHVPDTANLMSLRWLVEIVCFYAKFIPDLSKKTAFYTGWKRRLLVSFWRTNAS